MFVAGLLALAPLIGKKRGVRNWAVFALFTILAALQGMTYLLFSGRDLAHPEFFRITSPLLFLLGPALYAWYQSSFVEHFKLRYDHLWHLALASIAVTALLPFYLASFETKLAAVQALKQKQLHWHDIFEGGGFGAFGVYLIFMLARLRLLWGNPKSRYFFFLVGCCLLVLTLHLAGFALGAMILRKLGALIVSVILIISFLVAVNSPQYFDELRQAFQKEKYLRTLISADDARHLETTLRKSMQVEFLYREPDLSLKTLADKLKVSKHQLSEYLNTRENQNFTSYLNGFRIAEAKEKLRTEADKSILTVAYEVGFNSKTSFQRVFKQITGVTASEFRETHKN